MKESTKEKKDFEPFPVRTLRASDKIWQEFKKKRSKSGKTWNGFLLELIDQENSLPSSKRGVTSVDYRLEDERLT